ncbi:hypothetical protein AMS68_005429 [Peltaster fructicola]|uniref:Autophagy-related protein 1 n=1 Tax=Peltaster fructicola TaxID=286661 RepID=A0A6H0XYQ9_9PEZI|nr:hypothetical protein AMS68_005429 [Peltaster fructicola]
MPSRLARLSASPTEQCPIPAFNPSSPLSPRDSLEQTRSRGCSDTEGPSSQDLIYFDFTKIDYELERARKLGSGLWSNVYMSEPTLSRPQPVPGRLTPPYSPRASISASTAVFAIKVPARKDANVVLRHEAKMLSHLQSFAGMSQYVVPFFGLDGRNDALVFEAVIGGSMHDLSNRLRHMTDFARHQEVVSIFPGLAMDLISALEFMHDAGVVHADIKPQNVLLDVSDHYSLPAPVIRARFIDFSAAFIPSIEDSMPAGAGTWDYMAPEQISIQKDLSKPTFASDVWSLGITLLSVIVLGSPYTAACGSNLFMLREAVKSGNPIGFAKIDLKVKERMDACQSFIDCCRLALQKDRVKRTTAGAWKRWLEAHDV